MFYPDEETPKEEDVPGEDGEKSGEEDEAAE